MAASLGGISDPLSYNMAIANSPAPLINEHNMEIEKYSTQELIWPDSGNVILAQYDNESITVYQAYKPSIAEYAVEHQSFGGNFNFSRMTWIKPNFLWMMHRSGWGQKKDQEVILAIKIKSAAFEHILSLAVPSTFQANQYSTREAWSNAVKNSDVRLQWDSDHDPFGEKKTRRAIQIGLRGDIVKCFSKDMILSISNISNFVSEQRVNLEINGISELLTPKERVYMPADKALSKKLGIIP